MVESNGLLNRRRFNRLPGVRIPLSPPAEGGEKNQFHPLFPIVYKPPKWGDENPQGSTSEARRDTRSVVSLSEIGHQANQSPSLRQQRGEKKTNSVRSSPSFTNHRSGGMSSEHNVRHRSPSGCQATHLVRRRRAQRDWPSGQLIPSIVRQTSGFRKHPNPPSLVPPHKYPNLMLTSVFGLLTLLVDAFRTKYILSEHRIFRR